jgi:hypothetical protein
VKGTLGAIVAAYRAALLTRPERDFVFEALLRSDDIWINEALVRRVWDELRRGN